MASLGPEIDAHIAATAHSARSIPEAPRRRVQAGRPGIEDSTRLGEPAFLHHRLLLTMAAFEPHCACTFPEHALLFDRPIGGVGRGSSGRLARTGDLP